MVVSHEIEVLQAEHSMLHALLDLLNEQLSVIRAYESPDYVLMLDAVEKLAPEYEEYRGHYRRERALFNQLGEHAGRQLIIQAAYEQQRHRVRRQCITLTQLLCARANGVIAQEHDKLDDAIKAYTTGFRTQLAFEEYVLYPAVSVFLNQARTKSVIQ